MARRARSIALSLALVLASCAQNDATSVQSALGTVEFSVSCSVPAQAAFNRAVTLLHHMTYPQARVAFELVAEIDPGCAMAYWGTAMTLFQPTWPTRPGLADRQLGSEMLQTATRLGLPTERERLFVASAEAFFREPNSDDYWLRIRRWEAALENLYLKVPGDPDAAALFALSHLATSPADTISRAHADRAAAILIAVHEAYPNHPGAMHYLVHANDMPGRQNESLEITRLYEATAPRNPHALHMPTHIYTRLGDWEGVVRGNLMAAEAALEHPAGDRGDLVSDEFPHAVEYLLYAYLQMGADDEAALVLSRLRETEKLQPSFKTAFHLASTEARFALERQAWAEARTIVPRQPEDLNWDRFRWPEAVAQFAVGFGAVHDGDLVEAERAAERLRTLGDASDQAGENLFARNIKVLQLALSAWIADLSGEIESSEGLMREAAEIEVSTPKHAVTPGPILPGHELLGELLSRHGNEEAALSAFKTSLTHYPLRFNSLAGAARTALALGDSAAADGFYTQLLAISYPNSTRPSLREAADYVSAFN